MSLKYIDGFDQLQGQAGAALLSSLSGSGYTVTTGIGVGDGRKTGGSALELLVAAGTAGGSWSSRTNNNTQDLHGIAANAAGRMVAVGNSGTAVYSDDSVTWLPLILGVAADMRDVECHDDTWLTVGANGTILRSNDGRNYAPIVCPVPGADLRAAAWGNGMWVIVGAAGAAGIVLVSPDDGLSFVQIALDGSPGALLCVGYGANWVAGGTNGIILTSPDTTIWTQRSVGNAAAVAGVAYGESDHWLAAVGTDIRRSVDGGTTWAVAAAAIATLALTAITEADGRWVAVGGNGTVRVSDDEQTWTTAAFTGVGNTPLYAVSVARGARAGYMLVGALNQAQPAPSRRAVIYVSLSPPTSIKRVFTTTGSRVVIGFAHRSTARGRILSITDVLNLDWPAQISMLDTVGTAIPARNVWYYYEIVIDKTSLIVELYINNVLDISAPLPAPAAAMNSFEISWIAENGALTRLDDMYLLDNMSPNLETLVDRIGPIQIPLRLPDTDVVTEWETASGTVHWPQVGLLPPSQESFIRSNVLGKQDLFTSTTELPEEAGTEDAPIFAVGLVALAQKGDIDNRHLGLAVGEGVNQKEVVDTALSTVPEYSVAIFEKGPGDIDWTPENILTTPFGVIVR